MGQAQDLIVPKLGPGSQLHKVRDSFRQAGIRHGQVVRATASDVRVDYPVAGGGPILYFCNSQLRFAEVLGPGDAVPLPSLKDYNIAGVQFANIGFHEAEMLISTNGAWQFTVLGTLSHASLEVVR